MERETATSTPPVGIARGSQRSRPLHGRTSGPTRRSTKGQWTPEEDEILRKAVERYKGKNWKKIAECFKDRTDVQCLHRWQKVLNPELVKGPWSREEDTVIIELVDKYGPKKWSTIAQHLPGRIGKQCRERWHNHLNPNINKEAWTQEEELALIRAHQIYGNKWAELTKFLPGRTDNAIKNHWNSSVKKKLDSYIGSGLLSQFPVLPHPAAYQNHFAPSSSMMQSSGDDTAQKGAAEAEEISECSQGSTMVVCSQSASDMVLHRREGIQYLEESALGNELNCSPASSPGRYFSIEDVALSIPIIHPEVAPSSELRLPFPQGNEASANHSYQYSSNNLPNISSLEMGQQSVAFASQTADRNLERHDGPFQPSSSDMVTSALGALGIDSEQLHHILTSDEECCRILFSPETVGDGRYGSNTVGDRSGFCGRQEISSSQLDNQISASASVLSQPYDRPKLDSKSTSIGNFATHVPLLACDDGKANFVGKHHQLPEARPADQEHFVNPHDGFIYAHNSPDSPRNAVAELGTVDSIDLPKDQMKLVRVDTFCSASVNRETCPVKEENPVKAEKEEPGSLCYEPPRFPSLDIPFFSCDLVQSGNDMQMDYSPLGIRQLMMSSMNCVSPFRLWDSPTHDGSPDTVPKSAGKNYSNAPSILRKRHRDLLSPLSDRRMDKKLEIDTANLSRDFSRLDVIFDEKAEEQASPFATSLDQKMNSGISNDDDKENLNFSSEAGANRADETTVPVETKKLTDKERSESVDGTKEETNYSMGCKHKAEADDSSKPIPVPAEVEDEHHTNYLVLLSPDQAGQRTDEAVTPAAGTPRKQLSGFKPTCSETIDSSGGLDLSVTSPPVPNTGGSSQKVASASKLCLHTSTPLQVVVNSSSIEGLNIFGETPFRRSLESPSAWKSPWFMNSFLPGPRVETDITIEDIGYFMSPGDGSYDALGLMKHVSEQNADVFANAEEVLGSVTPKVKSKNIGNLDGGGEKPDQPAGSSSNLASNVLIERRTLDFSECGMPGRSKDKGKSPAAVNISSPSYLLKSCR